MGDKAKHKADLARLMEDSLKSGQHKEMWSYISSNSNLPGPRGNLELAAAFAEVVEELCEEPRDALWQLLKDMTSESAQDAPVNSPEELIPFCGALAVGAIGSLRERLSEQALAVLRRLASDERWRMSEGVAMGLQRMLVRRPVDTLRHLEQWAAGDDWLELRAVAAAVAEPSVLTIEGTAAVALALHRDILHRLARAEERKSEGFRVLRKALGYSLCVVVAAMPQEGFALIGELIAWGDPDIRWVVRQNLKKNRLRRRFPDAVENSERLLAER